MPQKLRILLVEDEDHLLDAIKLNLELEGYKVHAVKDGKTALKVFKEERFNLIILDVMLPEMDGFQVCETIRLENTEVPILFLTAKNTSEDRVMGLKKGADDYLVKPFNLEELSARVRSQLRQHQAQAGQYLSFSDLQLDPQAKTLTKAGQLINLTAKEFQILHKLMQKPDYVLTREQLEESLYAWGDEIESNAIEVFIYQIRKKIGGQYIKTIRGLGYRMHQE